MTIRELFVKIGFKTDNSSVTKVQNTVKSIKSMATKALSVIGISFSLVKVKELLEEWYNVDKVLKTVNTELGSQEEVQNKILSAANDCCLAYSSMCDYVTSLVKTGSQLFSTAEDAADFLTLANKAFQAAGATQSEISSLNNVLTNTFNTGRLSASGFSTVMSSCPDVVSYLANNLSMTEQQVKALGLAGKITAKQLYAAFVNSTDAINGAYDNLSLTISNSLTIIRNEWGTFLSQTNKLYDVTGTISKVMLRMSKVLLSSVKTCISWFERLTKVLGSARNAAIFLAAAVTAIIAAFKWQSIVKGVTNIGSSISKVIKGLSGINLKLLAIVGIVMLVILVIDDLMAFMNGDESLIGSIFEKLGIDGEQFREVLQQIVSTVQQMVSTIMPILQKLISSILPIAQKMLEMQFGIISEVAQILVDVLVWALEIIVDLLDMLMPLLQLIVDILDPIIDIVMVLIDLVIALLEPIFVLVEVLLELLGEILKPIMTALEAVVDMVAGNFADAFQFVSKVINTLVNGPIGNFLTMLKYITSFINSVFAGDWNSAWKALGNIPIAIINGIISAFESLLNLLILGINSITSSLSNLWTWIGIPAIPEIPEVSFGRIAYLAEGGYVEADNPTPVVIGDNEQEGEIVSPVSKMRDTVLEALHLFVDSFPAQAQNDTVQALGSSSVNKSVMQNVNIYNTFNGERDVQVTTSKAMKQSTDDLTNELAHAIAYMG